MSTDTLDAMEGFTFGADPEMFIVDSDGNAVSAAGLIPGTKEEPYPVKFGAVQVDGMAAEFNIDPASNFAEFNRNIIAVVGQLTKMLPHGLSLACRPSIVFSPEAFEATSEESKMLGCTPDFNAWTDRLNPPPDPSDNPLMRCAGGHIHIGWEVDDPDSLTHVINCRDLVKQLDWYLGAWSLQMDDDTNRRKLYGKAGACRIKPYGVEYRTLSNFWVSSVARRRAVWNRTQQAILDMRNHYAPERLPKWNSALVEAINTSRRNSTLEARLQYPIRTIHTTSRSY